jgi:hypothetical protein
MRGFFERRGREGFAKGAKEDKEKIKSKMKPKPKPKPKHKVNLKLRRLIVLNFS